MAYPVWITPAGNLGVVPEQEYYRLPLDAFDAAGGQLKFFQVSGTLPPGIQVVSNVAASTGYLQGIPISTAGPDQNQAYSFTVRVQNLSDGGLADRSFTLTITNVAPPVIVPRNVDLGKYFDGDYVNIQLEAAEFIKGAILTWTVKLGTLPPGLTLSSSGLLSGYLQPIPASGLSGNPGWDDTPWDDLGWQFPLGATSKNFNFTIEVFDGANYDTSTYKLLVEPKTSLTADGTVITADATTVDGKRLTVDTGPRHFPIITTTQADFVPERQGGWFSQQITAIDLDGDVLQYVIPALDAGAFDEQVLVGNSVPYVDAVVVNGNITVGTTSLVTPTTAPLTNGTQIQVLQIYTDPGTEQPTLTWYDATVNNYTTVELTGNTIVTGTAGSYITQSASGANATIANVSTTIGTIQYGGGPLVGTIIASATMSANLGDYITQTIGSNVANAKVTANLTSGQTISVQFNSGTFIIGSGNLKLNGANLISRSFSSNVWSNVGIYPTSTTASIQPTQFVANVGDIITQPSTGANATVINAHGSFDTSLYTTTQNPYTLAVKFNSGTFTVGSGNLKINGANVTAYPVGVICVATVSAQYNSISTFKLNTPGANVQIAGANVSAYPTAITSVGVAVSGTPSTQGAGFDAGRFDQGSLQLPSTLSINLNSGWITGYLPVEIANQTLYNFSVEVYKRDYVDYVSSQLYTLTVLGDLYNNIEWLTPSYLGSIENGAVSDLSITALSSEGKSVYYTYTPGAYISLPQGLELQPNGLISGRVSFELFSVDNGYTTFDQATTETTFDHTFTFSVDAITVDQTASATQTFTILVRERNIKPYDNLYLKAYLPPYQRREFQNIMLDSSVFPPGAIYRQTDPWFGRSTDIKTLFLAGLNPSTAAEYAAAVSTNHFGKRLLFGSVKSAVARTDNVYDVVDNNTGAVIGTYNQTTLIFVPTDYSLGYAVSNQIPNGTSIGQQHIKYEVVYAEVLDENTPPVGYNADTINLSGIIANPYYDLSGNAFVIATPNSFTNLDDAVVNNIGYYNKGALPDWMTSVQPNGKQLGFVRAVVLAYVNPGEGDTIAWRFQQRDYDLNDLNFTVDRYLLDNSYTANYNITANAFIASRETTFDRYPALENVFTDIGTVDYAVNSSFETINERSAIEINSIGGLDGITGYTNGQTLVFYQQEFASSVNNSYNQGWSDSLAPWDGFGGSEWDENGTEGWDASTYVPGYREWIDNRITTGVTHYPTVNQRIGVWTVNVDSNDYVTLTPTLFPSTTSASITGNVLTINGTVTATFYPGMEIYGNATVGGNSAVTSGTYITAQLTSTEPSGALGKRGTYSVSQTYASPLNKITIYQDMIYNNALYVRQGYTHGGTHIYYDPVIKQGLTVPNYSVIPQQIKTVATEFDGNGTKFYDYRDSYTVPEKGDSQVVFPHQNVFN